jgi:hypothetical protein
VGYLNIVSGLSESNNVTVSLFTSQEASITPEPGSLEVSSYSAHNGATNHDYTNAMTNSAISLPPEGHVESYSNGAQSATSHDYTSATTNSATNRQPERQVETFSNNVHNLGYSSTVTSSFEQEQQQEEQQEQQEQQQQQVADPAVEHVARLFPQYMCKAIRKNGGRASIKVNFLYASSQLTCITSLAIRSNNVAFIAMELFGIHLETEDGVRCIVLPNGANIVPGPDLLRGAQPGGVNTLLGSEISRLIAESPMRQEEVSQGILATNCVTMQVSGNPDDGGILNLNLAVEGGFEVKKKLHI